MLKGKGTGQAPAVQSIAKADKQTAVLTRIKKKAVDRAQAQLTENAIAGEDEFVGRYFGQKDSIGALEPTYNFETLLRVAQQNNTLGPCVAAMEINVDGTGHEFKRRDGKEMPDGDDPGLKPAKLFFDTPYPGKSMVALRREIRRDLEQLGNAFFEVLRTIDGKLTFINRIEAQTMRLLRLDEPKVVPVELTRGDAKVSINMTVRRRRFSQKIGPTILYFKEYGVKEHLDKYTGYWEGEHADAAGLATVVTPDRRATEVMHLIVDKDSRSPYGVPRWIPQVPSVLGSRKAEELNLEFFDAGGIPPLLLMVAGGVMGTDIKKQLDAVLSGRGGAQNRAAIIEIQADGGLNQPGNVKVAVERFGAERQQDSMFENYDMKCEQRVRGSFRLPPLFVGKTEEYNFATAYASYVVAEAQVFEPERKEFDELLNATLMRELAPDYEFVSKPLTVTDIANQFKGLELVIAKNAITPEALVDEINRLTGMTLPEPPEDQSGALLSALGIDPLDPLAPAKTHALANPPKPGSETGPGIAPPSGKKTATLKALAAAVRKASHMDSLELLNLATQWTQYVDGGDTGPEAVQTMKSAIEVMHPLDRDLFNHYVAMRMLAGYGLDPRGAAELCDLARCMRH